MASSHAAQGNHHQGHTFEAVGCRRRRVSHETPEEGQAIHIKQLPPTRARIAEQYWRMLHVKLAAAEKLAGSEFMADFQKRLLEKRQYAALYYMLEQLKASIWDMYQQGQLRMALHRPGRAADVCRRKIGSQHVRKGHQGERWPRLHLFRVVHLLGLKPSAHSQHAGATVSFTKGLDH